MAKAAKKIELMLPDEVIVNKNLFDTWAKGNDGQRFSRIVWR